jgi:hypothetical protein
MPGRRRISVHAFNITRPPLLVSGVFSPASVACREGPGNGG